MQDSGDSSGLDEGRATLLKIHVVGGDRIMPASNVAAAEEESAFVSIGALPPPYDPATLCVLFEHSNSLRQNVDAYAANIESFGHRLEATIDFDQDDAMDVLRDAMAQEGPNEGGWTGELTEEVVAERAQKMRVEMRVEKSKLNAFFESCSLDSSFSALRRRTRQDVEVIGNGYWEVLRNAEGRIAQFVYIPGFTMRLLSLGSELVECVQYVRSSEIGYDEVTTRKRFRRFVQLFETKMVYFKEYGDPRVLSKKTGRFVSSVAELAKADPTDGPASEVLHFKVHSSRSPYGVPRWIGNLLAVLGSRQAEEVNYLYFDNKGVPPLALLVSGGRVTEDCVKRLEDFIETQIKGKRNFHKILVLDAEAAGGSDFPGTAGRMKIDIKPLTGAQHSDALFQNYDQRNMDKVGQAFRLPRLLRGDASEYNRATAEASLVFAESQVFAPEREDFDFMMNRYVLADLDVRYWRFRSNAPTLRAAAELAPVIAQLVTANVLTPEEGRQLSEGVFNRDFRKIHEDWVTRPVTLTLAGVQTGQVGPEGTAPTETTPAEVPPSVVAPVPALGTKGDVCTQDLSVAGRLQPAQGGKLHRLPMPEVRKRALELLALRDEMLEAERAEARAEFLAAKIREKQSRRGKQ